MVLAAFVPVTFHISKTLVDERPRTIRSLNFSRQSYLKRPGIRVGIKPYQRPVPFRNLLSLPLLYMLIMAFSMHSHSGQFCPGHAQNRLEEIIDTAISRGMKTFALTEHMPRDSDNDLYPEEVRLLPTIMLLTNTESDINLATSTSP